MTDSAKSKSLIAAAINRKVRKEIDDQVAMFLKKGGRIEKVPNGVSGQQPSLAARRAMMISNKSSKKR